MKLLKLATLSFLLASWLWPTSAQVRNEEYWYPIEPYRISVDTSNSEVRSLISRWEAIGASLSTTKDTSAGTYEKSGYRGHFLRWSPEKGFIYVYHSEGLSIIDFSYGSVSVTSDGIIFQPEHDLKESFRNSELKLPRKWIPITVKSRSYIVPEEQLKDFSNYFAGFGEYNDFNGPCCEFSPFFVRDLASGDRFAPVLVIPESSLRLIKQPIDAKITYVGKRKLTDNYGLEGELYSHWFPKVSLTTVTINAGRSHGVSRKMLFRVLGQPGTQYLKITQVRRESSTGVIIRDLDDDGKERFVDDAPESTKGEANRFLQIRVGTRITTSPIAGS